MSARLTADEGASLLALARAAIGDKLFADGALGRARSSVGITAALAAPRACFVTLEIPAAPGVLELRGCIGSTEASLPAHEAVVESALQAAFSDPRFPPLEPAEYPALVISVSALTPMTAIASSQAIVIGRDGVALECDGRRAIFLPEVAPRYGWSASDLLDQLARKAGLPPGAWRRAALFTFESEHFGEPAPSAARIRRS